MTNLHAGCKKLTGFYIHPVFHNSLTATRSGILAEEATSVNPSLLLGSATWRDSALCRDSDPCLFFPVGTTGTALSQIDYAKHVCEQCVARDMCLEFALVTNQDSGVWGGASEEERRSMRRARRSIS